MTRKPTSDEQFGIIEDGDDPEFLYNPLSEELGIDGYSVVDDPGFSFVGDDDDY
jgi:hypothetical protein